MCIRDRFITEDPEKGWKLSRFIPDCRQLDPHDPEQVKRAMEMARRLHESGAKVERSFDFFTEGKRSSVCWSASPAALKCRVMLRWLHLSLIHI